MALPDPLAAEGQVVVAELMVVAGLVVAEPVRKGLSQPAAALEFQTQMVGSIAQTKKTRKNARLIARELTRGFRVQPNPADSNLLRPYLRLRAAVWSGKADLSPMPKRRPGDALMHRRSAFTDPTCHMLLRMRWNCIVFPTVR